tara:strand:- start:542 stop:898 length:357 start_codon:yes stop_codon:yes gene_type:complete
MKNLKSLYETYESKWKSIEAKGFVSLPEMAKHFSRLGMMDAELGYANAASKWCGKAASVPSMEAERRARNWLDERAACQTPRSDPADSAKTFLVICPQESGEKVQKILALLNCDFVEV